MKKLINTILIAFVTILLTSCMAFQGGAYSQNGYDRDYVDGDYYYYGDNHYDNRNGISIQVFYNALRPHGRWMRHSSYGDIWIPRVGRNFHPYATNGYWVMTNYGNTWVSDFSWGWAPFHYGRWFYDDYYGWAWIPGYEWAPAWVTWRTGGGYYGWAPMGPRMGINIHINLPINYWVFLPSKYMYHKNMHRYYPGRNFHHDIYNKTTIINNTYVYNNNRYYSGPTANEYCSTTGRSVNVRTLETNERSSRTAVNDRSVSVYIPGNSRSSGNGNVSISGNASPAIRNSSASRGTVNSSTRASEVTRNTTNRSSAGSLSRKTINNRSGNNRNTPARSSTIREINNSRSSNGGASRSVALQQTSRSRNVNVSRNSYPSSSSRNNKATVRSQRSSGSSSRSSAAVRSKSSFNSRNNENNSARSSSKRR